MQFEWVVVVVWSGTQTQFGPSQIKARAEGLSFYHPGLLSYPDEMLAVVVLSQHRVSSSKASRPRVPFGTSCMRHGMIFTLLSGARFAIWR